MTEKEKAKKYDAIVKHLWDMAIHGTPLQSALAAALIRQNEITGPNGEDPEEA